MVVYQPGQCIGPAERAKRRYGGYVGFLGVLQSWSRFCAGFGLAGVYDVSELGDERIDVAAADARRSDRRKALALQLQAVVLAVLLSSAIYAVGSILA